MGHAKRFCDGVSRRDMLRFGAAGLFGLSLPRLLELQAGAADQGRPTRDAPAEFRGEFRPIATNVTGIQIGEHMPRTARHMDKFSLIRSFRHHNSDHGRADHYMLTGYFPQAGFNPNVTPNNQRPAHGSIIARKLGPHGSVPPYVTLPRQHPSTGSAYLGPAAAPFVID